MNAEVDTKGQWQGNDWQGNETPGSVSIPLPNIPLPIGPAPVAFSSVSCRLGAKVFVVFLTLCLLGFGCATPNRVTKVFRAEKLAAMDVAIEQAIASNKCPGGVLWLERNGTSYHKAFGSRALSG